MSTIEPASFEEDLVLSLSEYQEQYAQKWKRESEVWMAKGVYDHIASTINLHDNGIHLDVGFGWGHLLRALHHRKKEEKGTKQLMGMDFNETLVQDVYADFVERNIGTNVYMHRELVLGGKNLNTVQRKFTYTDEAIRNIHDAEAYRDVSLIGDDVRTANVVQKILGERLLSSATLMFPGVPANTAIEWPNTYEICKNDEVERRIMRGSEAYRIHAYKLLTERVAPNGIFITTERIPVEKDASAAETAFSAMQTLRRAMGAYAQCWTNMNITVASADDVAKSSPMNLKLHANAKQKAGAMGLFIAELMRNDNAAPTVKL